MSATEHVFGYGSLVAGEHASAVVLHGYRRCYGVAMDNLADLPGYKCFLAPDGSRPPVFVAFLDIVADARAQVTGVCTPVDADGLRALDRRERNYERIDVTERLDHPPGRTWAYTGSAAGRERLRRGVEAGSAVISRDYLLAVEAGFRALGPAALAAAAPSLRPGAIPVRALRRVELPDRAGVLANATASPRPPYSGSR